MQNKGAIILFAILMALASIFQLSFTFVTSSVKNKAIDFAKGDLNKERGFLDSVANEKVYFGLTYKDCQKREINLGLDLKGGMNVTIEVSVVDLVRNLSDNSNDKTFNKAINLAKKRQASSQEDFITLFYKAFKEIDPNAKLNAVFGTYTLKDRIKHNTSDEDVLKILRKEANDAIDNSLNVLRSRIDRFGVIQPNIQKLEGNTGRILIELPGIKDPKRVRKLLEGTADLQFWETYSYPEVYSYFMEANEKLKEIRAFQKNKIKKDTLQTKDSLLIKDTTKVDLGILNDSTENANKLLSFTNDSVHSNISDKEGSNKLNEDYPLFSVLSPYLSKENQPINTAAVGFAHFKDTARVNEILNTKQIKAIFPRELVLAWEVKAFDEKEEMYRLVALKAKKGGKAALTGDVVTESREETDPTTGEWQVSMSMDADGAQKWARITKENIGRQVAILLDGYVYSFPVVNGEISGGRSSISGNFTQEEAKDLANILKSGKLQAPSVIIEEEIVGPSLGKEAINNGLISFVIAFILVLVYMIIFYHHAGFVANIALLANILFIFGVLASLNAVLTLPGIAGIVLTLGMAVDANVIIYERIKEEMALGKGLKLSVSEGFKHAYSAIIDGNVTTLITGIILYIFGHGPIKGFATTLIIGILTSLFSAIFISRIIFTHYLERNKPISFFYKFSEHFLKNVKFKFIETRKYAYAFSIITALAGIISLFTNGLNLIKT
jgi:SecD/SecF fusion protein